MTKKYIVTGSIVGLKRGSAIELTDVQAKSDFYAKRVRPADVADTNSQDTANAKALAAKDKEIAELKTEVERLNAALAQQQLLEPEKPATKAK